MALQVVDQVQDKVQAVRIFVYAEQLEKNDGQLRVTGKAKVGTYRALFGLSHRISEEEAQAKIQETPQTQTDQIQNHALLHRSAGNHWGRLSSGPPRRDADTLTPAGIPRTSSTGVTREICVVPG